MIPAATRAGHGALASLLDHLLPPRCALCDRPGHGICDACAARLEPPPADAPPPGLDALVCLCAYRGAGRELVLALKRGNRRDAARPEGDALAAVLGPLVDDEPPVVTWAPTTAARMRRRGFDQAELLARWVARAGGHRAVRLLGRTGGAQTGLGRVARLSGPSFVPLAASGPTVVLVDDVVTSGATMTAAASALRSAGAQCVLGAALGRAPSSAPAGAPEATGGSGR